MLIVVMLLMLFSCVDRGDVMLLFFSVDYGDVNDVVLLC